MASIRIRYTDILRTVSDVLTEKFGKNVYDVIEGFPRSCFMTDLHISETGRIMSSHIVDDMTLTIYYFPESESNNTAENMIMQEDLRDLIFVDLDGLLPVNENISLEILDYRGAVIEGVLQVKMDMTMNHKVIVEDDRVMEDFEITYNQTK